MEFVNDGTDERVRVQVDTTWALIGVVQTRQKHLEGAAVDELVNRTWTDTVQNGDAICPRHKHSIHQPMQGPTGPAIRIEGVNKSDVRWWYTFLHGLKLHVGESGQPQLGRSVWTRADEQGCGYVLYLIVNTWQVCVHPLYDVHTPHWRFLQPVLVSAKVSSRWSLWFSVEIVASNAVAASANSARFGASTRSRSSPSLQSINPCSSDWNNIGCNPCTRIDTTTDVLRLSATSATSSLFLGFVASNHSQNVVQLHAGA